MSRTTGAPDVHALRAVSAGQPGQAGSSADESAQRTAESAHIGFQTLVEQVPGILYIAEPGLDGRWLYVSPQVEDLLGWTPREWMADPTLYMRSLHPDDRDAEMATALPGQTLPGGRHVSEYRLSTRDGRTRWFRDDAHLLVDEPGRPALWSGVLTDITEQRMVAHRLRRSDQRARTIIETAMDAFVAVDAQGAICDWNRTAERLFGWTREEILGRSLAETLLPQRFTADLLVDLQNAVLTEGPGSGRVLELAARRRDGGELPVELTVWRAEEEDGVSFSAFVRDITERERFQDQLRQLAYRDPLTGLANRALFEQRTIEHCARWRARGAEPDVTGGLALMVIGLDDYRAVSVSLGREAAEELLATVAERLRLHAPTEDSLARLSDNEFALRVDDVATPTDARRVADDLVRDLRSTTDPGPRQLTVRASIGVRHCTRVDEVAAEELLADAAAAMLAATRGGRRVALFEDNLRAANLRRLRLTEALEHAVGGGQLQVEYQPYFALADGGVCGVEALARWRHPEYGEVSPAEFVVLAEGSGQIQALGSFVMRQACRDIARHRGESARHRDLALSVNVSARQLVDGRLRHELGAVLDETGLPGDALMLELTESALVEDELDVAERLAEIRDMGVHLAVDDFGTRYASLAYLQRFPVDTLKVDRSFVELVHEPEERRLTGAIITLAKTLGLRTIAEGIEEHEAALRLSALECDAGQGFFFARPVPIGDLDSTIAAGERRLCDALAAHDPTAVGPERNGTSS